MHLDGPLVLMVLGLFFLKTQSPGTVTLLSWPNLCKLHLCLHLASQSYLYHQGLSEWLLKYTIHNNVAVVLLLENSKN